MPQVPMEWTYMSRLEQIQQMLASDPGDVFLQFSLAMEYVKLARHEDALAQFARVNEMDADYVPAYFQQAETLVALKRNGQARQVLQQGIAAAQRVGDNHAVSQMSKMLASMG